MSAARPRLVLVHGWSVDARAWGDLARRLGADHEVLVPDLPGHRGAPVGWQPTDAGSFHDHAVDALAAWWQEAGAGSAPVVAWAWGGQVVVDAVHRGAIRPASVALVCGAAPFQSERVRQAARRDWPGLAERLVATMGARPLDPQVRACLVAAMTTTDPVAVDAVHATPWREPDGFALPPGSIAVLGAEDRLTPPGPNAELARRWGGRVHLLQGVGHVPFIEAADEVEELLRRWSHEVASRHDPGGEP